ALAVTAIAPSAAAPAPTSPTLTLGARLRTVLDRMTLRYRRLAFRARGLDRVIGRMRHRVLGHGLVGERCRLAAFTGTATAAPAQRRLLVVEHVERHLGAGAHDEIMRRTLEKHLLDRTQQLQRH